MKWRDLFGGDMRERVAPVLRRGAGQGRVASGLDPAEFVGGVEKEKGSGGSKGKG